jgi:hypothetical protein
LQSYLTTEVERAERALGEAVRARAWGPRSPGTGAEARAGKGRKQESRK